MHIGTISFCDRVGFNVKSDQAKKEILDKIEGYGIKIIQKHFERFGQESLGILQNNPHLVCTKTNGNPYLLYMTRYNGINQCLFIDKKVQQGYFYPRMILVKAWFDDDLFDGTLIDGEMVKDKEGQWLYIMNDLIVKHDELLANVNLVKRLEMLEDVLRNKYIYDPWIAYSKFQIKRYFHYEQIQYILDEYVPSLPYTIRGLIFKSLHIKFKDVLMNFDDNLIKKVQRTKYKDVSEFLVNANHLQEEQQAKKNADSDRRGSLDVPPPRNSMVVNVSCGEGEKAFYCKKTSTPDVYELQDDAGAIFTACVPTLKVSTMMREGMAHCNVVDRVRVICRYNDRFNKWMPTRIV